MDNVEVHTIEYQLFPPIDGIDEPPVRDEFETVYTNSAALQTGGHQQLVPVIQVFGRTKNHKSACVHVHNCYPTFFIGVPRDANLDEGNFPLSYNRSTNAC